MNHRSPQTTLGVVAISRNEEQDLPGFLEHLLPWVDEIVIIDDGSVDQSVEIIASAGEKVTFIENKMSQEGGFSEQRNLGIEASHTDWILNMDIDERVTPQLAREMLGAISNTQMNGFRYRRLNFFTHRPMRAGTWVSWNNPQLARRGFHKYVNRLHERCVVRGEPDTVGQLEGLMWHLNDDGYEERLNKSFAYSVIEAKKLLEKGRRISGRNIFVRPLLEFFKNYIGKRGIVDGVPGLIAAIHSADAVFRAYALAWDEQNRISREELEDQIRAMWKEEGLPSGLQKEGVPQHAE